MPRRRFLLPLLLSLVLHALPAVPALFGAAPRFEIDPIDDAEASAAGSPDAAVPPAPEDVVPADLFNVTVLEEAVPSPPAAAPIPSPVPAVAQSEPEPERVPEDPPAAPEPAEEPPAPPEQPAPAVADDAAALEAEALAQIDRDPSLAEGAPVEDDEGQAFERARGRRGKGTHGRRDQKTDEPCPPQHPSIIPTEDRPHWTIQRVLVEYYATHIREFDDLGSVWTHKGKDGRLDGVQVGLPRCSLLRQAGLRSGDVVHDVNGVKFFTVMQGFAAYFKLRDETELAVRISRRGQEMYLHYTVDEQKYLKRKARREAARAAGAFGKPADPPPEAAEQPRRNKK